MGSTVSQHNYLYFQFEDDGGSLFGNGFSALMSAIPDGGTLYPSTRVNSTCLDVRCTMDCTKDMVGYWKGWHGFFYPSAIVSTGGRPTDLPTCLNFFMNGLFVIYWGKDTYCAQSVGLGLETYLNKTKAPYTTENKWWMGGYLVDDNFPTNKTWMICYKNNIYNDYYYMPIWGDDTDVNLIHVGQPQKEDPRI